MNKENRLVKKQFGQFVRLMIFSHIDLELKMIRKTRRNTFEYPKDKKDYDRYAIIIGGSEYSGFKGSVKGIENLKEDEEVHIVYKLNGHYKNIIEINPGEIKEAIELLSQETKDKLKSVEMMMKKTNRNASEWTDEETKECLNNSSSVQ